MCPFSFLSPELFRLSDRNGSETLCFMTENSKKGIFENIYSVIHSILLIMTCFFVIFTFCFRLVMVSGDSMYPNLENGDKIIITNFLYKPDYGDIIAIGRSEGEDNSVIKRVIALPGDTVFINFDTHLITVNGEVITEDYEVYGAITEKGDFDYPLTVPEDCVFVLGDNRNNSKDSRFRELGFVSVDEITGHALLRLSAHGPSEI